MFSSGSSRPAAGGDDHGECPAVGIADVLVADDVLAWEGSLVAFEVVEHPLQALAQLVHARLPGFLDPAAVLPASYLIFADGLLPPRFAWMLPEEAMIPRGLRTIA